jgi:metallo-beta-lactamase class B
MNAALWIILLTSLAGASDTPTYPGNEPVAPLHIVGPLYMVGASDLLSYLVTTPAGHILIDAGYPTTPEQIARNVTALGFKMTDVRYVLTTQAHYDHVGGLAALLKMTGARLVVHERDADIIERGGHDDFSFGERFTFPPAHVDRRIQDGDTVELGGMTLTAHLTPGHTRGCTTWTFTVEDHGRSLHVVVLGGLTVPGHTLVNNAKYPTIAEDYEHAFDVAEHLPCDIFLGAHAGYFNGQEKVALARKSPEGPNPFIDPDGYHAHIAAEHKAFLEELARQKAAAAH